MDKPPIDLRETRRDFVLLICFALGVRILWLMFGSWMANDGADYLTIAGNLVDHGTFSLSEGGSSPTAFRPPLFPVMIALIWFIAGKSIAAIIGANVILGSLTVGLTYLTARRVFDRSTAVLAAGALAIGPMTSFFTVTVLTESLFTFLIVLSIYLWGTGRAVAAGVVFGLSTLARPTVLPFLLFLALLTVLPGWRPLWRRHVTILTVAMCVIGVWTLRNIIVFQQFAAVASAGTGVNLLCGTLETDVGGNVWNGTAWAPLDLKTNPVTRVDSDADEFTVDKVRRDRAVSRITSEPAQWLVARAKQYPKLFIDNGDYFLGSANLPIRTAIAEGSWGVAMFKSAFIAANMILIALAAIGLWWMRGRLIETSNIWLFPLFGALIHLPMWIEPRYYLPMMPMVFIMAAHAVSTLFKKGIISTR
jgi:4-amino-4-deoxy-L-arabinose transferase-like glycosyltransferase